LDDLESAFLTTVDRLTRESYGDTDGSAVARTLAEIGYDPGDRVLDNLARGLKDHGYIEAYFSSGGFAATALIRLTPLGRAEADEIDPIQRIEAATRRMFVSEPFTTRYREAFDLWSDAERLLWNDLGEKEATTVGHKLRESMQAFATALVEEHRPPSVDPDRAHARRRLGAVIAMRRTELGKARREALEALGDLWEATDALVQRQEHGAAKEGHLLGFADARRAVTLTLLLMLELVETLGDLD
jgi:hypothetical protein